MSEVEKMYENAGVGKQKYFVMQNENYKDVFEIKYPPFTAEKQIDLIKWLARFDVRIEYTEYAYAKYFIESHRHGYSVYTACFEQALAEFINTLWQDLTEQERTEIAEILRG